MDQTVINIILAVFLFLGGVAMTAIGWFANTIWTRLHEQERRMNSLEIKLAGEYVSNPELTEAINDIKQIVNQAIIHMNDNLVYIRNRIDGMPQRRESDPR